VERRKAGFLASPNTIYSKTLYIYARLFFKTFFTVQHKREQHMPKISKSIEVDLPQEAAFNTFIREFTLWWPKEYTWSKDKLIEISINPITGGHCTEIGPLDFHCDWGTVTAVKYGHQLMFNWQISASRVPEPDPNKSSEVRILFQQAGAGKTRIELEHGKFQNHGAGHEEYFAAMDSGQGWDYILACFAKHARTAKGLDVEVKS